MFRLAPRMPRHSTTAAYAVVNLPRNSVGTSEPRKNAVDPRT
jgi:hypothetical protein